MHERRRTARTRQAGFGDEIVFDLDQARALDWVGHVVDLAAVQTPAALDV